MSDVEDLFGGIELTDEELEGVAGGLGPKTQCGLRETIERLKASGWSLSQMIDHAQKRYSKCSDETRNEIVQFICDNW